MRKSPSNKKSVATRLWAKIDRSGGPDACWPWLASVGSHGYGALGMGGHRGPTRLAHRLAYELTIGPIPDGLFACHSCDNPKCCNPRHIFLGTNTDNLRDASRKGLLRGKLAGEKHPRARLTTADVYHIRHAAASGEPIIDIAASYRMHPSHISRVVRGLRWAHVVSRA